MAIRLIAGRYAVEAQAGAGGMGTVYRALDKTSGHRVALKVLHQETPEALNRFARERSALAAMRHPNIIEYLDHGVTEEGRPYLVMEWVEGEDLAARLARGKLPIAAALRVGAAAADALAAAHRQRIVHRDIKPQNLMLAAADRAPGAGASDPPRVKLLDFGIAHISASFAADRTSVAFVGDRVPIAPRPLTRTGTAIGTPSYMAPEQARGERDIDERADIFSLGCVLFECLTGRAPFIAAHPLAVLAKVLFEEAPRVSELSAGIPDALDQLVASMLAKERERRPADAAAIAEDLRAIAAEALEAEPPPSKQILSASFARHERRLVCVVLAAEAEAVDPSAPTLTADAMLVEEKFADAMLSKEELAGRTTAGNVSIPGVLPALRRVAERHRARLAVLPRGSVAAALVSAEPAADLAARAARCAIAIQALLPRARVALATGWDVIAGAEAMGAVIDRAGALLEPDPRGAAPPSGVVRLDRRTAALLEDRFEITAGGVAPTLAGEREPAEGARRLLGRPTSCVGRERELGMLTGLFEECVDEPAARPVLVTGPAGIGKSRLRMELLKRLRELHEGVEVWIARGDPMSAGSPFGLLAQLLRRAAGLAKSGATAPHAELQAIRERVTKRAAPGDRARIAEFLGALMGTSPAEGDSAQLAAARENPVLMADQLRRAWEDFVAAECAARPLVLVLDDLHWGDLPSLKLIDAALRNLRNRPLFVLAFARLEIHEIFPQLWQERGLQEIRLGGLTRRASESLVREVLGGGVDEARVSRIIALAAGNAFFLEELIRADAEGQRELPETVLAMLQVRLDRLPEDARRLLRAVSVFGKEASAEDAAALFWKKTLSEIRSDLDDLVEREILSARNEALPENHTYVFRHSLLRDAAYATLTDADRALAHRLAGEWLERREARDAMALAEHFERGQAPARALAWYMHAARQALSGEDLRAVFERSARAIACGASGEALGELRSQEAYAHTWQGELAEAEARAAEAMQLLPRGSAPWYRAAGQLILANSWLGRLDRAASASRELLELSTRRDLPEAAVSAMAEAVMRCSAAGRRDLVEPLFERLETLTTEAAPLEPKLLAPILLARSYRLAFLGGTPELAAELLPSVIELYEQLGDLRNACFAVSCFGIVANQLGIHAEAEPTLRQALANAVRMRLTAVAAALRYALGTALARRGAIDEARAMEIEATHAFAAGGNLRMEGAARSALARIHAQAGDLDVAEREARAASAVLEGAPAMRVHALAALASVLLSSGRAEEALAVVREMRARIDAEEATSGMLDVSGGDASFLRLVEAEALFAAGLREASLTTLRAERDRLLERASLLRAPSSRESFLQKVPANARVLELARSRLGDL